MMDISFVGLPWKFTANLAAPKHARILEFMVGLLLSN